MTLTAEEIAEKLVKEYEVNRKRSNYVYEDLKEKMDKLNATTTRKTTTLYNKAISSLKLDENGSIATINMNYTKVGLLMSGIDKIQAVYRKKFGVIYDGSRNQLIALAAFKDRKTGIAIQLLGDKKTRTSITKANMRVLRKIHMQGFKQMNIMLKKWKDFAYDMFFSGITKNMKPLAMKELFYNESGTLKIGSSLDEESLMIANMNIVEERTTFVRQKAAENGYKYCWNSNPLDPRTKPECMQASMAGVIPEPDMGTEYGFPPRFICRCDLVFVRPEWVGLNKEINKAIDTRRLGLINDLADAPKQKTKWLRDGKWVFPKDPLRRKGKIYKEISEKMALAKNTKVPVYSITDVQYKKFLAETRLLYGLDPITGGTLGGATLADDGLEILEIGDESGLEIIKPKSVSVVKPKTVKPKTIKPSTTKSKVALKNEKYQTVYNDKYINNLDDLSLKHKTIKDEIALLSGDVSAKSAMQRKLGLYAQKKTPKSVQKATGEWVNSTRRLEPQIMKAVAAKVEKKPLNVIWAENAFSTKAELGLMDDAIEKWIASNGKDLNAFKGVMFKGKPISKIQTKGFVTPSDYIEQRAVTQAYYDTLGTKKVTLHRGTDGGTGKKYATKVNKAIKEGKDNIAITDNALSGYSSSRKIAEEFGQDVGGITIKTTVNTEDVLIGHSNWAKKTNFISEEEFITVGGKKKISIADVKFQKTVDVDELRTKLGL